MNIYNTPLFIRLLQYTLLLISLIIPGGSFITARKYLFAFSIPVIGLIWVGIISITRNVLTPTGFLIMLSGLALLHIVSYLVGLLQSKKANHNDLCKILLTIPGVGVINATALFSAIGAGQQFKSSRDLAVWLGLTPKQSSSGDSFKSSGITKRGNRYLRKQLVHGARAILSRCKNRDDKLSVWANQLIERRGMQKATVAMAAKMARTAWVLLTRKEVYQMV